MGMVSMLRTTKSVAAYIHDCTDLHSKIIANYEGVDKKRMLASDAFCTGCNIRKMQASIFLKLHSHTRLKSQPCDALHQLLTPRGAGMVIHDHNFKAAVKSMKL